MKVSFALSLVLCMCTVMSANAQHVRRAPPGIPVVSQEPAPGTLRYGQKILVNNGYCQGGLILMLTGARSLGSPRGRECVLPN